MLFYTGVLSLAALQGAAAFTTGSGKVERPRRARSWTPPVSMAGWAIEDLSPTGEFTQKIEGNTRKTWKFSDLGKDRVQVAVTSEGRPVHADIQLWLGPDWTPFSMKAYSEDGKLRPIQTIVGTRNKDAMIEVRNVGEYEFPFSAASNYADATMAALPIEIPAAVEGERCDGGAVRSYPLDPSCDELEVVLNTEGKQLNARIELLQGPNNPKQRFECFTNNGQLNSLCVCFKCPDPLNTVRVVNLAPVEFPCYIHLKEVTPGAEAEPLPFTVEMEEEDEEEEEAGGEEAEEEEEEEGEDEDE